jgi:cytochrome c biogenesis protein
MELAITLLLTLAIASVVGTVLQQNQPYPDYVIKFGPYWFEVFETLGLYDVYSAPWFLVILTLLVISTSVCVIRHTPSMMKDMVNLRTHVQRKSLAAMHHSHAWTTSASVEQTAHRFTSMLKKQGFRARVLPQSGTHDVLVAAMKGGSNRLGYLFTHIAIVVICLGGLLDSNLPLKIAEWQGKIEIETENMALSQVPKKSRLPVGQQAFRGSVSIPEGFATQVVYLPMRDGYLVQDLPFTIEVKEFRVEHYATGQPRSFESDLVVHDPELDAPFERTISVNHPLIHKGYAIYQASFGDGGSELTLEAWPLWSSQSEPVEVEVKVFEDRTMRWGGGEMTLEVTDFRPFNINPDPNDEDPNAVKNDGPNFLFKMRRDTGEAIEYENYMYPVERDGRMFFLSGMRTAASDPFAYLYIPADADGSVEQFMAFLNRLNDEALVQKVANEMKLDTLASLATESDDALSNNLQSSLELLVSMFVQGGFAQVRQFVEETLPESERDTLAPAYLAMLREMLGRLYFADVDPNIPVNQADLIFLQDAIEAVGSLPAYASPVYLSLVDYTHIESTGLQIARSPGKNTVYFGCALLIAGVFLLFYVPQRRVWLWLTDGEQHTQVLLAGTSNRNPRDFDGYFEEVRQLLSKESGNSDTVQSS